MSKKICVLSHWSYKTLHGGNIRSYFLLKDVNRISKGGTVNIVINRLTLKGRIGQSAGDLPLAAECFEGFKSYEKTI